MAVYTKLNENNFNEFFSKYNVGKVLRFNGIKQGIENTNYFVQTEKAKLILTIYEKRVDENDLPFFKEYLDKTLSPKSISIKNLAKLIIF